MFVLNKKQNLLVSRSTVYYFGTNKRVNTNIIGQLIYVK